MKPFGVWAAIALVTTCLLSTSRLSGEVIVAEDFLYNQPTKPLGTLGGFTLQDYAGGQNGSAGLWTGPWVSSGEAVITGPDYSEVEDQFAGIVGDLGLPVNLNYLQRSFQPTIPDDQALFFSVRARVGIDAVNLPRMWVNAPLDEESQIAMGFVDGGFVAELGLDFSDNLDEPTNDGEIHQLVGKLEVNAQGNNDRLTVWLDPTAPETGNQVVVEANVIDSINDLDGTLRLGRLDTQCCGASGALYWDDVAIGTTWESVTQLEVPRLTLQVDPESGLVAWTNDSQETFEIKYYEILSPSGSLSVDRWNSLDAQDTSDGAWLENRSDDRQLIESNFGGATTLVSGQSWMLGQPFNSGGTQDLVARFATDEGLFNLALVEYGPLAGLLGDFNLNGVLDLPDIDDLTTQVAAGSNPATYDLNQDSLVNEADISVWIQDLFQTWFGDADLDGEFNSGDLVVVLASGTYENDVDSVWSTGDFNGDGRSNSGDLVRALSDGGYENGPRPAVAAVPELSTGWMLLVGGLMLISRGAFLGRGASVVLFR